MPHEQNAVVVKAECVSPPNEGLQQHVIPRPIVDETPHTNNIVKQEVGSSKQEHAISRVTKATVETPPRRVLRSTSRTKTTATVVSFFLILFISTSHSSCCPCNACCFSCVKRSN
ncbi:hypothetical protein ANCCAN_27074 [Ancylostoma caninum]|uniref:Uncharacterized protein n=1 Tax=Ancylostoma caninum TaxID=29170 RepID=A0A368F554_ANCCA|nr:hypothetical protein ANCCAN_27074 [Ancylostoma caninum]